MAVLDETRELVEKRGGELKGRDGNYTIEIRVAERKIPVSGRKLAYKAKLSIDEKAGELRFTEMLAETGMGMESGAATGRGFKTETFKTTLRGPRSGTVSERSEFLGKSYAYGFEWGEVRRLVEEKAAKAGLKFVYTTMGFGLQR